MIVDMHCHLDLCPDPIEVARQCREREVCVLSVTTTPKAWYGTSKLADGNQCIRTALGLHPQLVHQREHEIDLFDSLLSEVKYVGEIGLDGGRGYKEHWNVQLRVFRHILSSVSHAGGRIMSIHSRACAGAVLAELEQHASSGIPILHWFSGNMTELKRAIDIGCWFSVGPAMLNTRRGSGMVLQIPRNRLLSETDAPFAKMKGKVLMPWDARAVLQKISLLWGVSIGEVEETLYDNYLTLAGLELE